VGCARAGNAQAAKTSLSQLTAPSSTDARQTAYSNRDFIEIERRAASAWIALAEKNTAEAVQMMQSAADLEKSTLTTWAPAPVLPALEQLGDLLLELQRPREALIAFEASMTATPNRFNGLYGAAVAGDRAGDAAKADAYFAKLTANCKDSASDRSELTLARKRVGH